MAIQGLVPPPSIPLPATGTPLDIITLISLLGGGASLLGGLFGGSDGPSGSDLERNARRRPLGTGRVGDELSIQALIQLGATPQDIKDQLLFQRIAEEQTPAVARAHLQLLDSARSAAAQGNTALAQSFIAQANSQQQTWGKGKSASIGATYSLQDGEVQIQFSGELGERLNALDTTDIFENRVDALGNLSELAAGFPVVTEDEIREREALIRDSLGARLSDQVGTARERTIEEANLLGFNPSAELGEISREELLLCQEIDSEDALQRALLLLGGQVDLARGSVAGIQSALQPTLADPALAALGLNIQGQTAGFDIAAQLALANANAEQARSQNLLGAGDSLLSAGAGRLSSRELQADLGLLIEEIRNSR